MIEEKEFFGLNHYRYGEAYFGSFRGMRYRLAAEPLRRLKPGESTDGLTLKATIWPEPYAYGTSEERDMVSRQFPFSEDGLTESVKWMNERYTAEQERWEAAMEAPWVDVR